MAKSELLVRSGRSLLEGVEYSLERSLPVKGTIYAKLGDVVKPETIVGEAKVSAGFRVFSLADYLKVPPNQVKKYLHRTIGSRVYQGDVVAEASKLFGKKQFISPIDGMLQSFDVVTGQLTMRFAPTTYRLPAGVRGEVSQIVPEQAVYVKTHASLLFGAFGSGHMREGALKLVAPPDQPISAQSIDAKQAGYIIGGGSGITRDALNRALAVGVKGIITGGIGADDLLAVSGDLHGSEDVGLSLLITSGLGNRPMDGQVYAFLEKYKEQQVYLLPKQMIVLAPLPLSSDMTVNKMGSLPDAYGQLEVGQRVRILTGALLGESALVKGVVEEMTIVGSKLKMAHCLLERQNGDTIHIPITNIELLSE